MKTLPNTSDVPLDVTLSAPLTCRCPVNHRQDHGTVMITYRPDQVLLEYSAVVEWLALFATEAHAHEALTALLLRGVVGICAPQWAEVVTTWAPVEGVSVSVKAAYGRRTAR